MKRPGSGGTSAIFLAASAMLFISGAVLLTHPPAPVSGSDPARLVAQAAAPSGSSSMITKGVLESPCENGYVYEIQTAPKDSKEPFVIKRSLNPDDPDKRWSGTVKYRRPPTTPGGKATIITLACRDKVADMIKLTRDVTNLGSGPKLSYGDFAVDFPMAPRSVRLTLSGIRSRSQQSHFRCRDSRSREKLRRCGSWRRGCRQGVRRRTKLPRGDTEDQGDRIFFRDR